MMRSIWVHQEVVHHKLPNVFRNHDEKEDKPNLDLVAEGV